MTPDERLPSGGYWVWIETMPPSPGRKATTYLQYKNGEPPALGLADSYQFRNITHISDDHVVTRWRVVSGGPWGRRQLQETT